MATKKKHTQVIAEIEKRYGRVIDLQKSPNILIEILRNYGKLFTGENGDGGVKPGIDGTGGVKPGTVSTVAVGISSGVSGGGGVNPGVNPGVDGTGGVNPGTVSTVAVGINPETPQNVFDTLNEILKAVLKVQRQVNVLGKQTERK